jgi:hypothetical protein
MFDDIAHCARLGLVGGAGRTIPLASGKLKCLKTPSPSREEGRFFTASKVQCCT